MNRGWGTACAFLLLSGCADLKKELTASPEPQFPRGNGVVLIAEVCVQQEGLTENADYFALAESRSPADGSGLPPS